MDIEYLRRFRSALRRWYRQHARDLPWRIEMTPYRIWVSEVMLQQTQVSKVIPYYHRFLAQFPDIASLAAASEESVLRCWEGLGYYRRARQLHRAARLVVEQHDGTFPSDPDQLRALPGIGRYTAGAILSIAFEQRQPILEANTIRLLSRVFGVDGDVQRASTQQQLWQLAEQILPARKTGDFNQALMELGSQVCHPRRPSCSSCPLGKLCQAHSAGLQELLPVNRQKVNYESIQEAAVVVRDSRDRVLLRKCGDGERWAGLWDFPRFVLEPEQPDDRLQQQLANGVQQLTGVQIGLADLLATMQHSVTRFRITLHCYLASSRSSSRAAGNLRWLPLDQLDDYPLSSMGREISERLLAAAAPSA